MLPVNFDAVAISSRIRLARNFADYPFPALLMRDPHAEEQAGEIVRLIAAELDGMEKFRLYDIGTLHGECAEYLMERNLISRDLVAHCPISAALISADESISVMINEEDHLREQYFMRGFDLRKAYERIAGIDDAVSESIPFAYDEQFGYLTACPTNLGTGLRASVMLFLPACARRGGMKRLSSALSRIGLTVRGAFGEGSGTEGDSFQVSNEVTLGQSETEILSLVERAVEKIVQIELRERQRMKAEEGVALKDRIARSYGILTNCCKLDLREFVRRAADVKLGIALGYLLSAEEGRAGALMQQIDEIAVAMRPANIDRLNGAPLSEERREVFRAGYVVRTLRKMDLILSKTEA